jgi:hypothetical protein
MITNNKLKTVLNKIEKWIVYAMKNSLIIKI